MKKIFLIGIAVLVFISVVIEIIYIQRFFEDKCAFFRNGKCIACTDSIDIPVGFKENCKSCPEREVLYVGDGMIPAWVCQSTDAFSRISGSNIFSVNIARHPCPSHKPLKDVVGNCYSCDTTEPVRVPDWSLAKKCLGKRYFVQNTLSQKSILCPDFSSINNPEICDMCNGGWDKDRCYSNEESIYCNENTDCPKDQWCYPFMIDREKKHGICTAIENKKWLCSKTDGYKRSLAEKFCARQGARIPSLEDLVNDRGGALAACPHNDMWTFFGQDSAMYMDYLSKEFLITRDGEIGDYGQTDFFALCIKE